MTKKSKADYEGLYYIAKQPARMKPHNKVSWDKLVAHSESKKDGKMDFDEMSILVKEHEHGTAKAEYPYQFITYCIKSGWLKKDE